MSAVVINWKRIGPWFYVSECSAHGDCRLLLDGMPARDRRGNLMTHWVATAELVTGESNLICQTTSFEAAKREAEQWAKEYAAQ